MAGWWFGCHEFYFPRNIGNNHHPNWRTLIFFRGVFPWPTNQNDHGIMSWPWDDHGDDDGDDHGIMVFFYIMTLVILCNIYMFYMTNPMIITIPMTMALLKRWGCFVGDFRGRYNQLAIVSIYLKRQLDQHVSFMVIWSNKQCLCSADIVGIEFSGTNG